MKPSRRGLFGLLAGAAAIPFLPKTAPKLVTVSAASERIALPVVSQTNIVYDIFIPESAFRFNVKSLELFEFSLAEGCG